MAVRFMGVSFRGGRQVAARSDAGDPPNSPDFNGVERLGEVAAWCPSFRMTVRLALVKSIRRATAGQFCNLALLQPLSARSCDGEDVVASTSDE